MTEHQDSHKAAKEESGHDDSTFQASNISDTMPNKMLQEKHPSQVELLQPGSDTLAEWIGGTATQNEVDIPGHENPQDHAGFAWSLYHHTLELFKLLLPHTMALIETLTTPDIKQGEKSFKKSLGKLFLWGGGFSDGRLESVLDESECLKETVLESLTGIGKILLLKLAPKRLRYPKSWGEILITQEMHDLGILIEKARLITEGDYESDDSSNSVDSVKEDSLSVINSLGVYVGCLMELLPSMEETLASLDWEEVDDTKQSQPIDFQISGPAQPYVLKVYDKFPLADLHLMHRLGEANWQRHMSLRAICDEDEEERVVFPQEMPKITFVAVSEFKDSGVGSSLPAHSTYAATVASHSSFQTTADEKNRGNLRVPPTPKEVSEGEPFQCQICGQFLRNIKNRVDWRRHIFADLKPYLCTFPGCKDEYKTFATRKLWEEHEFGQHRVNRFWACSTCQHKSDSAEDWRSHLVQAHNFPLSEGQYSLEARLVEFHEPISIESLSCPLCLEVPGKSQRHFATHVGKHMEGIALAALPRDADSSDTESITSDMSDASDPGIHAQRAETKPSDEGRGSPPYQPMGLWATPNQPSYGFSSTPPTTTTFAQPQQPYMERSLYSEYMDFSDQNTNSSAMKPTSKSVVFELLFPEAQHRARPPMRVPIYPYDTTDSIMTTVKNSYGLHAGPSGAKEVIFEDDQGNSLIARYENLRHNMVVYVRVIEDPTPITGRQTEAYIREDLPQPPYKLKNTLNSGTEEIQREPEEALRMDYRGETYSVPAGLEVDPSYIEAIDDARNEKYRKPLGDHPADDDERRDKGFTSPRHPLTLKRLKGERLMDVAVTDEDEKEEEDVGDVRLYGGLTKNGKPAELVRIKDGKATSLATGLPIGIGEGSEDALWFRRSLSEEAEEDESILRVMSRRKTPTAAELMPKRCREPGCDKEFKRPCDLTKHEKTHSRPWKCPVQNCKYYEYGWPTEKELNRHYTDKHDTAQPKFECHYKPCPYQSKREFNCKQHMEKAHGWEFTREKKTKQMSSIASSDLYPSYFGKQPSPGVQQQNSESAIHLYPDPKFKLLYNTGTDYSPPDSPTIPSWSISNPPAFASMDNEFYDPNSKVLYNTSTTIASPDSAWSTLHPDNVKWPGLEPVDLGSKAPQPSDIDWSATANSYPTKTGSSTTSVPPISSSKGEEESRLRQNPILAQNDTLSQRLQAANSQHLSANIQTPLTVPSRERSPFRQGSPLAPAGNTFGQQSSNVRFGTAQHLRQQQKAESDARALQQQFERFSSEHSISPKDVDLLYHENEEDANSPLIPPQQQARRQPSTHHQPGYDPSPLEKYVSDHNLEQYAVPLTESELLDLDRPLVYDSTGNTYDPESQYIPDNYDLPPLLLPELRDGGTISQLDDRPSDDPYAGLSISQLRDELRRRDVSDAKNRRA
ncbi:hypothetical protein VTL71DRAFT_12495 [Oculimacula yallundae]|uniref:C2H2-type domain-containing protein n=1 Tax=Oculimacula yallundae TaxID=86028 RepID=A0ABR4CN78_9HELO